MDDVSLKYDFGVGNTTLPLAASKQKSVAPELQLFVWFMDFGLWVTVQSCKTELSKQTYRPQLGCAVTLALYSVKDTDGIAPEKGEKEKARRDCMYV